jgi:hypothetical protein
MIGLFVGLLVAGAVAVYLSTSDGDSGRPATAPPKRGVACPALRDAFEQSQAGNQAAFRRSVEAAARAGEGSLDRSGQVFGRPEEIALELEYAITKRDSGTTSVPSLLNDARVVCARLGRWEVDS